MNPLLFSFTLQRGLIMCPVVVYHQGTSIVARRMVVDTGASCSIINPYYADVLGVEYATSVTLKITTAAGSLKYPHIVIDQAGVHQANVCDVDFLLGSLPDELAIDGILGYSFLKHFEMKVNYPRHELTLKRVSAA